MKSVFFAAATIALSVSLLTSTPSGAVSLNISSADLAGGASFIGGGTKIKFDPNEPGSATFTLNSIPNQEYVITVTGHNDDSNSYFNFFIDADGPGAGGFVQLGGNSTLQPGFVTITLPAFTDLGTTDFFKIVNGGTGNLNGQIDAVSINAVPGPVVGAGIPGLVMALGGLVVLSRRRRNQAAVA
jgi:hypothetical protein